MTDENATKPEATPAETPVLDKLDGLRFLLGHLTFAVRDCLHAQTLLLSNKVTADEAHTVAQQLFSRIAEINKLFVKN